MIEPNHFEKALTGNPAISGDLAHSAGKTEANPVNGIAAGEKTFSPAIHERKGHTPGELKACPYVISGPWTDDNGVTTVEIQIVGGHEVVAEIYADKAETALRMANEAIAAWNTRTVDTALLEVLKACRAQFDFYAAEHRKSEKHEKAATNERFAFLCSEAITKAEG